MEPRRGRRPIPRWRRRRTIAPLAVLLVALLSVTAAAVRVHEPPRHAATKTAVSTAPDLVTQPDDVGPDVDPTPSTAPELAAHPQSAPPAVAGPHIFLPILLYHYIRINPVASDTVGFNLSVTPANFAKQMALLRFAGAHTVTLADAMHALQTGQALPPHSVVLTFDDGYLNFATKATPVLVSDGLVGTVFVVSGFMGRRGYMSADQVRQVDREGMVVGAHTVNHIALAQVPLDIAKQQIDVSHAQLAALLGHDVLDFAYPYGYYDAAVEALVAQDGFRDAVTTETGDELSAAQPFAWPRYRVGGTDTLFSFAHKALLGMPVADIDALVGRFIAAGEPQPAPATATSTGGTAASPEDSRRYA